MAIYNDIVGKIEAGSNVSFSIHDSNGAIIINSSGGGGAGAIATVTGINGIVCSTTSGAVTVGINPAGNVTTSTIGLASTGGITSIIANPTATNNTYTLPSTSGSIGQVLQVSLSGSNQTSLIWKSLAESDITNLSSDLLTLNTFKSSAGQAYGLATLDVDSKIQLSQIPSIAITSVSVVATIAARNALTNVGVGDVAIVTSDPISSNNGSYIYNGTTWNTLSVYIQPTNLSSLTDCKIDNLTVGDLLYCDGTKWINNPNVTASSLKSASAIAPIILNTTASPSVGQVLTATGPTEASWQTPSIGSTSLSGLTTDVSIGTTINNDLLQYSQTLGKWKNSSIASVVQIQACGDAVITGLADKDVILYNSSSGKFINSNLLSSLVVNSGVLASSIKTFGNYPAGSGTDIATDNYKVISPYADNVDGNIVVRYVSSLSKRAPALGGLISTTDRGGAFMTEDAYTVSFAVGNLSPGKDRVNINYGTPANVFY